MITHEVNVIIHQVCRRSGGIAVSPDNPIKLYPFAKTVPFEGDKERAKIAAELREIVAASVTEACEVTTDARTGQRVYLKPPSWGSDWYKLDAPTSYEAETKKGKTDTGEKPNATHSDAEKGATVGRQQSDRAAETEFTTVRTAHGDLTEDEIAAILSYQLRKYKIDANPDGALSARVARLAVWRYGRRTDEDERREAGDEPIDQAIEHRFDALDKRITRLTDLMEMMLNRQEELASSGMQVMAEANNNAE